MIAYFTPRLLCQSNIFFKIAFSFFTSKILYVFAILNSKMGFHLVIYGMQISCYSMKMFCNFKLFPHLYCTSLPKTICLFYDIALEMRAITSCSGIFNLILVLHKIVYKPAILDYWSAGVVFVRDLFLIIQDSYGACSSIV